MLELRHTSRSFSIKHYQNCARNELWKMGLGKKVVNKRTKSMEEIC